MADKRIISGFGQPGLKVVHSREELLHLLQSGKRTDVVGAFMSSGDFNGLTTDDLKKLYSPL